jgi:hypothetical protein
MSAPSSRDSTVAHMFYEVLEDSRTPAALAELWHLFAGDDTETVSYEQIDALRADGATSSDIARAGALMDPKRRDTWVLLAAALTLRSAGEHVRHVVGMSEAEFDEEIGLIVDTAVDGISDEAALHLLLLCALVVDGAMAGSDEHSAEAIGAAQLAAQCIVDHRSLHAAVGEIMRSTVGGDAADDGGVRPA